MESLVYLPLQPPARMPGVADDASGTGETWLEVRLPAAAGPSRAVAGVRGLN